MLLAYLTPSKDIFLIAPSPDPLKQLTCFCWYNRPQTVSRFTFIFVWLQSTSALTSTFTFYMAQLQLSSCQPSASATSYLPCGFLHITAAAIGQSITVSSSIKQSIARAASSPPPPLSSDNDAQPHHCGIHSKSEPHGAGKFLNFPQIFRNFFCWERAKWPKMTQVAQSAPNMTPNGPKWP